MSRPEPGAVDRRVLLVSGALAALTGGLALLTRGERVPEPRPAAPEVHRYGSHPRQMGELHLPGGRDRGTVVMLHGGFWQAGYDLGLQDAVAADLAGRGWAVWNLDYRPVGDGGGWPATFDDVRAGVGHLGRLARSDDPILLGHSAGGQLAVWAAGEDLGPIRPRAAVPMAGILDLTNAARDGLGDGAVTALMGGDPGAVPDRYAAVDPIRRLPLDVPVHCVHGEDDTVVPPSQSAQYVEASGRATARAESGIAATLVSTPGGHFNALDPESDMWERTVDLLGAL